MKLIHSLFFASVVFLLTSFSQLAKAQDRVVVQGFLVDMSVVDYMLSQGASGVKIFAARDNNNNMYYIMAPTDAQFNVLDGQLYRQNFKGDCPPSCEYKPATLEGGGAYTTLAEAKPLVNNYFQDGVTNCVMLCNKTLTRAMANYAYIKVTFDSAVKVKGLKYDGSSGWNSDYNYTCNTKGAINL